jgi:signal transduction histidine kinase
MDTLFTGLNRSRSMTSSNLFRFAAVLHRWRSLLAGLVVLTGGATASAQSNAVPYILTNALQIRELNPNLAQKGIPVQLRGVVTYHDVPGYGLVLQDATAGIVVRPNPGANTPAGLGQEIEVQGVTVKGDDAPIVEAAIIHVDGPGQLPEPRPVSFDEMSAGSAESQWVEVRGVVRAAAVIDKRQFLSLFMNGQRLTVSVKDINESETTQLLDAVVRMRGVGCSRFNQRRQVRLPWLAVSSFADIVIERTSSPAPEADFPAKLSKLDLRKYFGRRVNVAGVVTLQKADGDFFMQSDYVGLYVRAFQPGKLTPGEQISVSGYAMPGQYTPIVEDAMVRQLGHANQPPALPVDLETLLHSPENFEGVLVSIKGELLNRIEDPPRRSFILQSSNVIFLAQSENSRTGPWFKSLKNGSRLLLTGVFDAQPPVRSVPLMAPSRENAVSGLASPSPESIKILLRSPADLVVLGRPSWLTPGRLLWVLVVLSLALLATFARLQVLNGRIHSQTHALEQTLQRESVLLERDRIAREFHDSLEQEIAAISMQLDAVEAQFNSSPQIAHQLLGLVRTMARQSLAEARRSMRDLRAHLIEQNDLPAAIREMAAPLSSGSGIEIAVEYSGTHWRLPVLTEHHLLRVAQEAIANAFKHARAKKVIVALNYLPEQIQLSIRDDGVGFDPDLAGSVSGGHFGLLDMRERTEKIGGQFVLCSRPGHGTEVLITLAGPPPPRISGAFDLNSPP